ncbi:hypothetical protein D9758_012133 [Tetrapyrgos nigripes]|uniref:MULE transposase domain-containing protein n=1 Tax=Tetrapyrgos nigripes TaxID=182062 RepID=A0A8H5CN31_9AGAR|nr:hypothetical protein D9758_012133 [Tetrapyrgos nigripes]
MLQTNLKKKPKLGENGTNISAHDPTPSNDEEELDTLLRGLPTVPLADFVCTIENLQCIHSFDAQVDLSGVQLKDNTLATKAEHIVYHKRVDHRNTPSARFQYSCSQNTKRQRKPVASQRDKGQMHTFKCDGWLAIKVFEDDPCAWIHLKHKEDHILYDGSDVPPEIRTYVKTNFRMSTSALWTEILRLHPKPSFKRHQIASIAQDARRKQWCRDPDQLKSAKIILDECKIGSNSSSKSLWSILPINLPSVNGYSGIAFSLPDVLQRFGGPIREISLDSAWNTNGSRFELYALLGEVYGSGCPLGFLLLQSPQSGEAGVKEKYIYSFLEHFKLRYDLCPAFTLSDKDLSEINAFLKSFPDAKHQLCLWHCLRAVKQRLSILHRPPKVYNVTEARNEFGDAINRDFVPVGQVTEADRVDFPVIQETIPRLVIRLGGTLQNTAPPKPRLFIRINGRTQPVHESPAPEPSGDILADLDEIDAEQDDEGTYTHDPEFSEFFNDNDTDSELGPDWMFGDDEKPSSDPKYVFCPAPHRKQLLHLFTRHFCQHPLLPERLETQPQDSNQIRRNAVMEMYTFCFQRGL